jgi:hypothetical protein
MVRNFIISKTRQFFPQRRWQKKTGPGVSSLIAIATSKKIGINNMTRVKARVRSMQRLATGLLMKWPSNVLLPEPITSQLVKCKFRPSSDAGYTVFPFYANIWGGTCRAFLDSNPRAFKKQQMTAAQRRRTHPGKRGWAANNVKPLPPQAVANGQAL